MSHIEKAIQKINGLVEEHAMKNGETLEEPADISFILFVCEAVRVGKLATWLECIVNEPVAVSGYYAQDSMVRIPASKQILLQHVQQLNAYKIPLMLKVENLTVQNLV